MNEETRQNIIKARRALDQLPNMVLGIRKIVEAWDDIDTEREFEAIETFREILSYIDKEGGT